MRTPRAAGALLTCTAIGAIALGGASTALAGRASSAGCRASSLTAAMSHVRGADAAGHTEYRLVIANRGASACRLADHPQLRLLRASGAALPTHVTRTGRGGAVTIPGHGRRSLLLRFSPDVPGPGEPQTGAACEPVAAKVRVTLGAPGRGSIVARITPPTSVCEHGSMFESAL